MNDNKNSVEDDKSLTKTNRTCYRTGYIIGTYDTILRVAGLYVTYKLFEFIMEQLVLYPDFIPSTDDDDDE